MHISIASPNKNHITQFFHVFPHKTFPNLDVQVQQCDWCRDEFPAQALGSSVADKGKSPSFRVVPSSLGPVFVGHKCRLAKVVPFFWTWFIWSIVLGWRLQLFWETFPLNKNQTWTTIEKRDGAGAGKSLLSEEFLWLGGDYCNCRAPVSQHKQNCHKTGYLGSAGYNDCHGWCWLLEIYLFVHANGTSHWDLEQIISIIFIEAFGLLVQDMSNPLSVLKKGRRPWKKRGPASKKNHHPRSSGKIPNRSSRSRDIRVGLEAGKWDKATCVFSKTFRALPCSVPPIF